MTDVTTESEGVAEAAGAEATEAAAPAMELDMSPEGLEAMMPKIQTFMIEQAPGYILKFVIAIVIFWIATAIARRVYNFILKQVQQNDRIDNTLGKLGATLARYALLIAGALIAVSILGVKVASILGIFAAMTLAIGLALQGSMSNVAAGLLLVLLRPYKIGDYVEIAGQEGDVEDLNIFTTTLRTLDNIQVIISNGEVRSNTIRNFTSLGKRRVDMDFGIDYGDDMDKAIAIVKDVASKDKRLLTGKGQEPWAKVMCLNDSSVDIQLRVWCKPEHYWDVRFDLIKSVKEAFDAKGITIPFPHVVEISKTQQTSSSSKKPKTRKKAAA